MLEKITKVIRDYKEDQSIIVTENNTFAELGLDSLATAELVMNLEDELGVTVEMDQNIKTVGDLIKILNK